MGDNPEISIRTDANMTVLDGLAAQARTFSDNAVANLMQLGRVFIEAKALVPHGQFYDWVEKNSGMSQRSAQQFMAAYRRFGENTMMRGIEKSKVWKMLTLPEGTEEKFLTENNVQSMSSREIEEAVKRVREEAQKEIDALKDERNAAQARAKALADRPFTLPDEVTKELSGHREKEKEYQQAIEQLKEQTAQAIASRIEAEQEAKESETLLKEAQEDYNRVQDELLSYRSAAAKGDAERTVTDTLTADEFAAAVRSFMGQVSQMPYMRCFATMSADEIGVYEQYLETIEDWAKRARNALNTVEGSVVIDV